MVKASSPAATKLAKSPSITTAKPASVSPSASASPRSTRPEGIGRPAVRRITASMSQSCHMLSAPAAPAPTAMQTIAARPITGCSCTGAQTRPTSAVKTTSRITRGFSSST